MTADGGLEGSEGGQRQEGHQASQGLKMGRTRVRGRERRETAGGVEQQGETHVAGLLDGQRVNMLGQNQAAFLNRGTAGIGAGQSFGVGDCLSRGRTICRPELRSANARYLPPPWDNRNASIPFLHLCGAPLAESRQGLEIRVEFGV